MVFIAGSSKLSLRGVGQKTNRTIKQADTLLLGYPLNWNMSRDILKNDLQYYEDLIDERTPAMTYSFMTVAWKFAEQQSRTMSAFQMSYQNYLVQPFKVCTHQTYAQGLSICVEAEFCLHHMAIIPCACMGTQVWTEYNEADRQMRERSTVNFLPGQGGYIQSIVYGFAGMRIRPEQLEFHNPQPPPDCREVILKGQFPRFAYHLV